jgi:hypothetical protein
MPLASTPAIDALFDQLLAAIASPRNQAKKDLPQPRFNVYMENLGWAQLFEYDMNRLYSDAVFAVEMQLRQKLFHIDNYDDDTVMDTGFSASVGMYWDYTTLGMSVWHEPVGVPHIQDDHPLTKSTDLSLIPRVDFKTSGIMPELLGFYDDIKALLGDRGSVGFPTWGRGPLDMAIQLRGYVQFVEDCRERPQFVHDLMQRLVEERINWWEGYCEFFGTTEKTAGIADDWINIPFISPSMFADFCMPYYLQLEQYHGAIPGVHSCGDQVPIQKYLLQIKTLGSFEVNPWTDLRKTLANVPADKWLGISIKNVDVLCAPEEQQEAKLREIVELCAGRNYGICGQALQKLHPDMAEDIARAQRWIGIARKVLGRE